jgi:hypothetical protein
MAGRDTAPGIVARRGVWLAVRFLPTQRARERYAQEFLAEMYGMSKNHQLRQTLGHLTHALALRTALSGEAPVGDAVRHQRKPFLCRLNLHHHWTWGTTDDGVRYRQCALCGKDHPSTGGGGMDYLHGGGMASG